MPYANFGEEYPRHRKVRRLADGPFRLHVSIVCQCSGDQNDGIVTLDTLEAVTHWPRLSQYLPDLLQAGLLHDNGDGTWTVHDYLDYNISAADHARRASLAKARKARWKAKAEATNPTGDQVERVPDASENACGTRSGTRSERTSRARTFQTRPDQGNSPYVENLETQGCTKRSVNATRSDAPTTLTYADPDFADFWAAYPRKVGKKTALAAWVKALHRETSSDIIAAAYKLANDPNLPEKQFIPHPTTWLNRDGWLDDPYPTPQHANRPGRQIQALQGLYEAANRPTGQLLLEGGRP